MSILTNITKALPFKITRREPQPQIYNSQYGWLYPFLARQVGGDITKTAKVTWATYYNAMDNEVVSACIDAYIVETLAAGFDFYSEDPENDDPDVVGYMKDLFNRPDGPDGRDSYTKFMWRGLSSYLGPGDWFAEVVHDDVIRGLPVGMYFIQPHRMNYHFDTDQWGVMGTKIRFENDELIHVEMPDPWNELWGKSLIDKAAKSITLDILGMDFNKDYFKGGISPKNFVEFEAGIPDSDYDSTIERIKVQAANNPRGTYFLRGGKFKDPGRTNRDMEFNTLLDRMRDRIVMTWQVPPKLVGIKDTGQLGGKGDSEEDMKLFRKRIKGKVFKVIEDEFNRVLGKSFDLWGFEERFHFGDIDVTDKLQEATIDNINLRNGSSTVNEVKAKRGEDPVPWGDEPLPYVMGSNGYLKQTEGNSQTDDSKKVINRDVYRIKSVLQDAGFIKAL